MSDEPIQTKSDSTVEDKTSGVVYSNSKGTFFLRNGKLYDEKGKRTSSLAVSTSRDPLKKQNRKK